MKHLNTNIKNFHDMLTNIDNTKIQYILHHTVINGEKKQGRDRVTNGEETRILPQVAMTRSEKKC